MFGNEEFNMQTVENNINNEITLSADEYKKLVLDEWDWKLQFLAGNALYSATAQAQLV